ncbi:hypothetical protein ACFE04_000800 [Oxalis oulophora]
MELVIVGHGGMNHIPVTSVSVYGPNYNCFSCCCCCCLIFAWRHWPPNFSAALAEMLVQSTVKDLYLLPALPQDKWANGCVKGLKARGGVTVNISWKEGGLHEVGLWSHKEQRHNNTITKRLHYRGNVVIALISSGKVHTFNRNLKCVKTYALSEMASFQGSS